MRLKNLIKSFEFSEAVRSKITLGSKVRLNPSTHRIQLEEKSDNTYPTDNNLYVKTWITNPLSVKQWLGFHVVDVHYQDYSGTVLTSLGFRLSDGINQYAWIGSAWVVSASVWNTEQEVADHISTFPTTSKKLQVVINLKTTDENVTPEVKEIKILWSSDIEFQEDLIYRSLIPFLKEKIRPIADHVVKLSANSTTIDLDNFPLETPYNIIGIDSVYNHTTDSEHSNDLFQSYNSGTKVITLKSSISADNLAWIRFTWEPEIAVTTSQEFYEIDKVPAIHITGISLTDKIQFGSGDYVANKGSGSAVKVNAPLQADIDIVLLGLTSSAKDQMRLSDEIKKFFSNNVFLKSKNLDENYDLWQTSEYELTTVVNQNELHSGTVGFKIKNAKFFTKDSENVKIVKNLIQQIVTV